MLCTSKTTLPGETVCAMLHHRVETSANLLCCRTTISQRHIFGAPCTSECVLLWNRESGVIQAAFASKAIALLHHTTQLVLGKVGRSPHDFLSANTGLQLLVPPAQLSQEHCPDKRAPRRCSPASTLRTPANRTYQA